MFAVSHSKEDSINSLVSEVELCISPKGLGVWGCGLAVFGWILSGTYVRRKIT